jgi:hypothetical protein
MVARFHYDDQVYRRLLDDGLTPNDQSDVTEHIEGCAECQSRLEAIAELDLPWGDVRRLLQRDDEAWPSDAASIDARAPREARHAESIDFLSPSDDPNSLGRFGRYEIREILGRGGMGVVMRGYDPALDRHSAIKVLAPELATNASARNRFSREAKSAAAVVHQHVVPIQTVDEQRGLPYLVMPVVEGASLEQRVAETGPLTVIEILRIGKQIASGLAAAHAQGLVHRDVKPANVEFEVLQEFVPGDGYEYVVWSVRILMERKAKPGWTYAFGIRERFICCRLIDDGTIAWGEPAKNGLQAGVQFIPSQKAYAKGQKVAVRFFFRNTAAESLDISLPNLMTHGYYEEIHVKNPNGKAIFRIQDEGPGGPVGWMKVSMDARTTRWVNGLPIQVENGPKDEDVETVICAKPGETCRVSFTLPNFAAPGGKPLNTGEIKFQVAETAAPPQVSIPSADMQGRISRSRRTPPRERPKTTDDDLIPADAQP